MAVYVDTPLHRLGRMTMCHMAADTVEELHAMADAIGVPRKYYQGPPVTPRPHYDICKAKRALAVSLGAVECRPRDVVAAARRSLVSLV